MSQHLNPSEAARRLGLSVKALRLYEQRGLLKPLRTAAGWRAYGPDEMRQASEIAALRALGFSLVQVGRILEGDAQGLEPVLAAQQAVLEDRIRVLADTAGRVRGLREEIGRGRSPTAGDLAQALAPASGPRVAFDLPWPWDGERFELGPTGPLTYLTGPLGSGKTRLAQRIAETLPGAVFLGLDRLDSVPVPTARVEALLAGLLEDGASASDALRTLLCGLDADGPTAIVVDMPECRLDRATQEALIAQLRRRGPGARPLFLLTRSSALLDLDAARRDEAIVFCPANHAVPYRVAPYPGAPGYEALSSCLATPEVRARTEGVVAMRPVA